MTHLPLLVLPSAERDILAAANDYDARLARLGERFVSHVEQAIERIRRHPHSFQRLDEQFRRAIINTFPYAVAYRVLADRIEVVAVFPCRMDPDRLADRLTTPPK